MYNETFIIIYSSLLPAEVVLSDSEFDNKNDDEFPPSWW